MADQAAPMTREEMEIIINTMKETALLQEDLLLKVGEKNKALEQDFDEMCEEMEMGRGTKRTGRGARKIGGKQVKDNVDVQMLKIVADTLTEIFRQYKFTRRSQLLRYSNDEDGSFCARIRAAFRRAGIRFNRLVWKTVCEMGVTWLVRTRSMYVTHVRNAVKGKHPL